MDRYQLDPWQLKQMLEKVIDLFLEYQYKHGYDEPQARTHAVQDVVETIRKTAGR